MSIKPYDEEAAGRSLVSLTPRPEPPDPSAYPDTWRSMAQDYDPNAHLMQLKGKDYLDVQHRMVWFIRDQRALIVAGVATQPYAVTTELVELDRPGGWAHFRTTVRDVLGNEATAYGSESAKDFGDYIEKAATKSLGRALIGLGYGTQFAPEISEGEGERPVDSPVAPRPAANPNHTASTASHTAHSKYDPMSDQATRARLTALGYRSVAQVEEFLAGVRKAGEYSERSIKQAVVALEQKAAQAAQASLAGLPVGTRGS